MQLLSKFILGSLLACVAQLSLAAELTIYTYDSFNSEWGPGPKLTEAFQKQCNCTLKFVTVEDGVGLLNRLRLEGKNSKADVVLGLDEGLLDATHKLDLIAEHGVDLSQLTPSLAWQDKQFVPFDYGYFAFIYDSKKITQPVTSLHELIDSKASVIYEDPRTSTPGQGLLLWVNSVYGEKTPEAWKQLATHTVTVTKGWTEAYSMFLEGGADYVLSYSTSPAYHIVSEQKDQYQAALFSEGHVAQVEVAARLNTSQQPELAQQFLSFLISKEAQSIIPVTNWMLPVIDGVELPAAFSQLIEPKRIAIDYTAFAAKRDDELKVWRDAAAKMD